MSTVSSFSSETLHKIIKKENIIVEKESPKKGDLVEAVNSQVDHIGFNIFSSELTKDELASACKVLKIKFGDDDKEIKNPSKAHLRKRLAEKAEELGLKSFFSKFADDEDLLTAFIDTAGLDEGAKPSDVQKEVQAVGLTALLERLDTPFLKDIAEELNVSAENPTKGNIVEAIVTGKNVKASKDSSHAKVLANAQKEAEKAAKKDKPSSIKKGVTYQDLFQHFTRTELYDWSKDNNLKLSGNKPELIRRILAFLDGDTENTVAQPKEAKEKKEAPKSPKKETKKKTTEKKAKSDKKSEEKEEKKSEKKTDKKKAEKEKEEEKEEQEEDEEEEKEEAKEKKESKKEAPKSPKKGSKKGSSKN